MGKFKKKPPNKAAPKQPIQKSRKEMRKEQRKEKKLKRTMRNQWMKPEPETEKTDDIKETKSKLKGDFSYLRN